MFLRTLAEETCRLRVGRRRSHHCVQGTELAQVFQTMNALGHLLLQVVPIVETLQACACLQHYRLLIMQQLHYHLPLCILVEYHLQVGSHRQDPIHTLTLRIHPHQGQQSIEIGIMPKAQVCTFIVSGDGCVSICLDTLPEGDGRAHRDTLVQDVITIAATHPRIVLLIDCLKFLLCEQVVERELQFHILHIRSHRMQFRHQLRRILQL